MNRKQRLKRMIELLDELFDVVEEETHKHDGAWEEIWVDELDEKLTKVRDYAWSTLNSIEVEEMKLWREIND